MGEITNLVAVSGELNPKASVQGTVTSSKVSLRGVASIPEVIREVKRTPATRDELGMVIVCDNLNITEDGVLSVDVATSADPDNTKPITSAAVNTLVGNIDALLSSI